ncbi:ferrous iron transporter B [Methanothrix harundinacea]|uniref:Iron transport protein, putative n=1 Tax=Methanothrix harundinacea (strain 6Ac) TaxID=1110509 RepID=G7WLA9_METH6|nr:Iron transport protein, putative [Methanothrix harundinacea 6Ac]
MELPVLKIILMGNPNVGKSVVFSRLTGIEVISSNYPGTTVEYTLGRTSIAGESAEVIDPPGVYSLEPSCRAEEVTREIFEEGADVVVDVVDATNLERNLNLTLQILERGLPTVVVLNLWDVATRTGIEIDLAALEEELGVPVVPAVAVSGQGIRELAEAIPRARVPTPVRFESADQRWARVGEIVERSQRVVHKHPSLLEKLEEATIKPLFGVPFGLLVLYISFTGVIKVGEALIDTILDPAFAFYGAWITEVVGQNTSGILRDILIGTSPEIDTSFGLLTTGLYVPLGMVLPFVIPFYIVLGVLEDVGYLPRISVLVDALMHRVGLHGAAVVPCILGLGCNVPGVMATRVLESEKQRYLAATLMAVSVPCAAQNAMIWGLLGPFGLRYIAVVYGTLFLVFISAGFILSRIVGGESPEIFLEIPPYRVPDGRALFKKTWMRSKHFLKEAVPYVLLGVFLMNVLFIAGVVDLVGGLAEPIITGLFGLPKDAAATMIVGFLRKDVAVGMLAPLGMTAGQLVVASVVLAMYFPCVATFAVFMKELGLKNTARSALIMVLAATIVGTILNALLSI